MIQINFIRIFRNFGSRQETVDKALASLKEENAEWPVEGAWPDLADAAAVAA